MAYEKHTWQTNELVTAEKLNHIEQGINQSGGARWDVTIQSSDWTLQDNLYVYSVTLSGISEASWVDVNAHGYEQYFSTPINWEVIAGDIITFSTSTIPTGDIEIGVGVWGGSESEQHSGVLEAVPVYLGGTGAKTAADARVNLGITPANIGAIASSEKGANNGVAELDENGKVPSSQLPSYVDDVLEYSAKANFPATGETGKIYVDTSTNLTYRWSGTAYVEISASLALGTTSSTAFRGDYGNAAYTHAVTNKGAAFSSGLYKITTNSEGHVTAATAVAKADITGLGIPASDTDTKVTSAANHYTPSRDTSADKSASASGATAAWGIDVVKGVTVQTDGKGHVTGVAVTSGKIPANPDTNTHRPIQVNGTEILGNNTTALNLKAGSNVTLTNSSGTVTIAATDTTYSSLSAASGNTSVSLVTRGEKYTWNNKSNLAIGTTASTAAAGNHTHTLSLATSSGTNQITLAANTKYQLTAGGSTYIFTTPSDTNTWRGIQNNLTSTSTTDSLSAYQGKILNDKLPIAYALYHAYLQSSKIAGGTNVTVISGTTSMAAGTYIVFLKMPTIQKEGSGTVTVKLGSKSYSYTVSTYGQHFSDTFTGIITGLTAGSISWSVVINGGSYTMEVPGFNTIALNAVRLIG